MSTVFVNTGFKDRENCMPAYSYSILLEGFVMDNELDTLPAYSGIYCIYEMIARANPGEFEPARLLYIGEAGNLRERIKNHDKMNVWQFSIKSKNKLGFTYAKVDSFNRLRVKAALVFRHKPELNDEYLNEFPFHATIVKSDGRTDFLDTLFSVAKS